MFQHWEDLKSFLAYIFIGLIGIIAYFFRDVFAQHKEMRRHYLQAANNAGKLNETEKCLNELKLDVVKIETNYIAKFDGLKSQIHSTQENILHEIRMIMAQQNKVDNKIDNIDIKIDDKIDKFETKVDNKFSQIQRQLNHKQDKSN